MFPPVLAQHSKSFSLVSIAVGVNQMQRNFEPMRKPVEAWQRSELRDATAKMVVYDAFVEGKLEAPKHLARTVHDQYFEPKDEDFQREQSGASPRHSRRRARNWIQFLNSRQQPSWDTFLEAEAGSHSRSSSRASIGQPPLLNLTSERCTGFDASLTDFPETRFRTNCGSPTIHCGSSDPLERLLFEAIIDRIKLRRLPTDRGFIKSAMQTDRRFCGLLVGGNLRGWLAHSSGGCC